MLKELCAFAGFLAFMALIFAVTILSCAALHGAACR